MEHAQTERRGEQRFPLCLPIVVKPMNGCAEESSLTRDVSASGVFFHLEGKLAEGTPVEMVLTLPSEITLTESILVRCKGKVVRVVGIINGGKTGVAAAIEQYDFVAESDLPHF
jgi:hypothetical protein